MGFKLSFYKNLLNTSSYTFLNTGISFFSSVITARLLTPEEFGTLALITVFSGFIAFFKDSGISYLVVREDYNTKELGELHSFSLIVGGILFMIMLSLAYPISLFYENRELIYPTAGISFVLLLESVTIVPFAELRKNLKFNKIGQIRLIALLLSIGTTIVFAYYGFSYWALIFGQWVSAIAQYFLMNSLVRFNFENLNFFKINLIFTKTKKMLYHIAGSRAMNYWSNNTDNLLVGKFYGIAEVGIYSRAYQLLTMQLNLIGGAFNSILLPSLKKIEKNSGEMRKEFLDALSAMSICIFPVMVTLLFFSDSIILLLWGNQWTAVATIVPYFGVLAMTYLLISTFGSLYVIGRQEHLLMPSGFITSIVTITLIVTGITFSIEMLVVVLTSGYVLFVVPIHLYFASKRAGFFRTNDVAMFWVPKIVFSLVLIFTIYFNLEALKLLAVGLFFIHLVYALRNQLKSSIPLFRSKLNPGRVVLKRNN